MTENPSSSPEIRYNNGPANRKLFDTYYTIHVQESIGTTFPGGTGDLAILGAEAV